MKQRAGWLSDDGAWRKYDYPERNRATLTDLKNILRWTYSLLGALLLLAQQSPAQTIVGNVALGSSPVAVAIDPALNKVYFANSGSNTVTSVDEFTDTAIDISVGSSPIALAVNPTTGNVYVANTGAGTVSVIAGATHSVTATVSVGRSPVAIAANYVTNQIFVANRDDNTVTIIDGATNATSTVAVGTSPVALAVNPVDDMVYVANQSSNNVTILNGQDSTTSTAAAGSTPTSIAACPTTNTIYIVNRDDNTISVLSEDGSSIATVAVGKTPQSIAINPVTNKIYVPSYQDGSVTVIDGATNATTTISVNVRPLALAVNSLTNQIYVANAGTQTASASALLSVIDGATNKVTNVTGSGKAVAIALDPKSDRIYVPSTIGNTATILRGATNKTTSVSVGSTPEAIAFNPVTKVAFVCNYAGNSVSLLDTTSNTVTTLAVGTAPVAVAVNPVTNRAYVANSYSGTVSVIDGDAKSVTATIPLGFSEGDAIAINSVTNKIYVAVAVQNQVAIIDGASNDVSLIQVGKYPVAVAINPVANRVYVLNSNGGSVSVLDGSTGGIIATIPSTQGATKLAVNPVTNKIYVGVAGDTTDGTYNLQIIDGATNQISTLSFATNPDSGGDLAINTQTNRIYAATTEKPPTITVIDGVSAQVLQAIEITQGGSSIIVDPLFDQIYAGGVLETGGIAMIDGVTNTATTISGGASAQMAGDPLTGRLYAPVGASNAVTEIAPEQFQAIPLELSLTGVVDSQTISTTNVFQTKNPSPTFTAEVTSSYTSASGSTLTVNPPPVSVYYQIDGGAFSWTQASQTSASAANPATFSLCLSNIPVGLHTLYYFPSYGDDSNGSGAGNGAAHSLAIGNVRGLMFLIVSGGTANGTASSSCASTKPPPGSSTATTTTTLTASTNPQVLGGSVTFTATVAPATAGSTLPTGTVSFFDGSTELGTTTLGSSLTADFTTSSLASGDHTITARYSGDTNHSASTSAVLTESIVRPTPVTTTTAITSSANPQTVGASVTFTSTVTSSVSSSASLTGSITFYDGATKLGTSTLGSNLTATYTTSSLTQGSHLMTAVYSGDTNFGASTSAVLTQSITASTSSSDFILTAKPTSLTLTAGGSGTVTLTLAPESGFQGAVNLSCAGLPSNISCSFASQSLTLNGTSSQSTILTLSAAKQAAQLHNSIGKQAASIPALLAACMLPGAGIGILLLVPTRRLRCKMTRFFLLIVLIGVALGLGGCGVTFNGYPGTYQVVVSASANSGTLAHQTTIDLTVRR